MTDLINKVDKLIQDDIQSIEDIATKYKDILEVIQDQKQIPYLAYIIDICVNHIKEYHNKKDADKKAWAVVVIKNLFTANAIKKESDILKTIDEFFKYVDDEFPAYFNNHIGVSIYDVELGFVYGFVKKKIRK